MNIRFHAGVYRRFGLPLACSGAILTMWCVLAPAGLAQDVQEIALPNRLAPLELPSPEIRAKEAGLIQQVIEPELILRVDPTRSKLIRTKLSVSRIAITDPDVIDVNQFGPREMEIIGRKSGETTLTIWFIDAAGAPSVLRYLVRVAPDRAEEERADLEYGHLQSRLNELFPNSQIQLIPLIDKLIVRGQARDAEEAAQIMSIIRGQMMNQNGQGLFGSANLVNQGAVAKIPGAEDLPAAQVISLLRVPGEQQIMLKVRIAELSRTALRDMGMDFNVLDGKVNVISNFIGGAGNISAILDGGDINLFLRAFSSNGNSKILAEPTLVTLSGHTATFIAGGEFAVPQAVGIQGIAAQTTFFRGFGTQLNFTPTVLDKDRVRLHVSPSFSTLNKNNAVNGIPGLNTRAVATTVDLREGQWLAIAGLIQDEQEGSKARIPYLGDIPVVGGLFGRKSIKRNETELVVLVSPELVHPLEFEQVPLILPGVDVTEPTDAAFYLLNKIEGRPDVHYRSTYREQQRSQLHAAKMDARRTAKSSSGYLRSQRYYMSGPQGFSE